MLKRARTESTWLGPAPTIVAVVAGTVLVLALAAVVAIDVFDVFGVRQRLFVQRDSDYPYVFYHLYAEGRPVEWVQWLLLSIAAVAAGVVAGWLHAAGDTRRAWGFGVLGLAFGVLLMEDAGGLRDVAGWSVEGLAGAAAGTATKTFVLAAIAVPALFGLVVAWPVLRRRPAVRNLLLGGYGVYALAGVLNVTGDLWYPRAGTVVMERLLGGRMLPAPESWESHLLPWVFMDSVMEETVELIAPALIAIALLVLLRETMRPTGGAVAAPRGPAMAGRVG